MPTTAAVPTRRAMSDETAGMLLGLVGVAIFGFTLPFTRLAVADSLGLFASVKSKVLESRIPAHLRTDTWFAFSTRARVIVYAKDAVNADDVADAMGVSRITVYNYLKKIETEQRLIGL